MPTSCKPGENARYCTLIFSFLVVLLLNDNDNLQAGEREGGGDSWKEDANLRPPAAPPRPPVGLRWLPFRSFVYSAHIFIKRLWPAVRALCDGEIWLCRWSL